MSYFMKLNEFKPDLKLKLLIEQQSCSCTDVNKKLLNVIIVVGLL